MDRHRIRGWAARAWAALLLLAPAAIPARGAVAQAVAAAPARLPERLSDGDFWTLLSDVSEPGGYFRIRDNFTSNEREIGQLFGMLRQRGTSGGVYLGVGPEQNLTYIAAIRPQMAFIVDIRRQAVMQHLMFKAIFERAADRADFIAMLFSKPRPAGLDSAASIQAIWDAFWTVRSDSGMWIRNASIIVDHLTKTRGFALTADEVDQVKYVFESFFLYGPVISTRGYPSGGGGNNATFADLTGYSPDASGEPRSFLSSEEHYQFVKSLHERNLIVPVSGDFGGPKAIRAIAGWLSGRGATVSAFYVSNVEQYLFQDGKANAFYDNVATLPVNDASIFIRPYSLRRSAWSTVGGTQSLCPIAPFLQAVRAGRVLSNNDALACPG